MVPTGTCIETCFSLGIMEAEKRSGKVHGFGLSYQTSSGKSLYISEPVSLPIKWDLGMSRPGGCEDKMRQYYKELTGVCSPEQSGSYYYQQRTPIKTF